MVEMSLAYFAYFGGSLVTDHIYVCCLLVLRIWQLDVEKSRS